jgi:hypothetical protein
VHLLSIYNVRLYEYANSRQIRIYKNPIIVEDKKEKKEIVENEDNQKNDKKDSQIVVDDEKEEHGVFRQSANRTKQNIYEISRANIWDWFITLTFDRTKIDSSDYDSLIKTVGKWFNHVRSRKCPDMKYLIVPELHKDGMHYHFHGLLADCDGLQFVDSGIVQDGKNVYNMPDFKFGFTTATRVEDTNRASSYICKYITKELEKNIKGKRRYMASRNCNRASIKEYNMTPEQIDDLLLCVQDDITYMKSQIVSVAGQCVNYIELKKEIE